eukprot:GHVS01062360.1.p1 GENE.GHVS01062360.1~~GHVS01062360.1.p1  ORF type:complete len:608 (-),score=61.51 GHVS01062360.1:630-2453(-)
MWSRFVVGQLQHKKMLILQWSKWANIVSYMVFSLLGISSICFVLLVLHPQKMSNSRFLSVSHEAPGVESVRDVGQLAPPPSLEWTGGNSNVDDLREKAATPPYSTGTGLLEGPMRNQRRLVGVVNWKDVTDESRSLHRKSFRESIGYSMDCAISAGAPSRVTINFLFDQLKMTHQKLISGSKLIELGLYSSRDVALQSIKSLFTTFLLKAYDEQLPVSNPDWALAVNLANRGLHLDRHMQDTTVLDTMIWKYAVNSDFLDKSKLHAARYYFFKHKDLFRRSLNLVHKDPVAKTGFRCRRWFFRGPRPKEDLAESFLKCVQQVPLMSDEFLKAVTTTYTSADNSDVDYRFQLPDAVQQLIDSSIKEDSSNTRGSDGSSETTRTLELARELKVVIPNFVQDMPMYIVKRATIDAGEDREGPGGDLGGEATSSVLNVGGKRPYSSAVAAFRDARDREVILHDLCKDRTKCSLGSSPFMLYMLSRYQLLLEAKLLWGKLLAESRTNNPNTWLDASLAAIKDGVVAVEKGIQAADEALYTSISSPDEAQGVDKRTAAATCVDYIKMQGTLNTIVNRCQQAQHDLESLIPVRPADSCPVSGGDTGVIKEIQVQ